MVYHTTATTSSAFSTWKYKPVSEAQELLFWVSFISRGEISSSDSVCWLWVSLCRCCYRDESNLWHKHCRRRWREKWKETKTHPIFFMILLIPHSGKDVAFFCLTLKLGVDEAGAKIKHKGVCLFQDNTFSPGVFASPFFLLRTENHTEVNKLHILIQKLSKAKAPITHGSGDDCYLQSLCKHPFHSLKYKHIPIIHRHKNKYSPHYPLAPYPGICLKYHTEKQD